MQRVRRFPISCARSSSRSLGAGELAAVGNANPKDVASFREPTCRTFRGRCLAILRPFGHEGTITLAGQVGWALTRTVVVKCVSL